MAALLLSGLGACATAQSGVTSVDAPAFQRQMEAQQSVILLDVRTDAEIAQGHLPGAVSMDVLQATFKEKAATLDLSQPIFVYCQSGGRSMKAARILQEMGARQVVNLEGGFGGWQARGLPVEK